MEKDPSSAFSSLNRLPTRLVICVDGTDQRPAGAEHDRPTNVYRIYSSIKSGKVVDAATGDTLVQVPLYYPGIGGPDDLLLKDKLHLGNSYQDQIRNVYERCSRLSGAKDEVVFFGFSRGAYVVRAVAGLLHQIGALKSAGTPEFARDYKKVLKESGHDWKLERANTVRSTNSDFSACRSLSSLSSTSEGDFQTAPAIRFLGAFDTVRAIADDDYDTSFNLSTQHWRHAVALHENRKALAADVLYPEDFYRTDLKAQERSFVQALFIGSHGDMGGTSPKAGLSLYPLQWMLLEAIACGVHIELEGTIPTSNGGPVFRPLAVVFPKKSSKGKDKDAVQMTFTTANGVSVTMQDLRSVHDGSRSQEQFGIRLTSRPVSLRMKKQRTPFDNNGYLRGYCDHAPQGTIIHPSVYLLLDEHINVALDTKEAKLQRNLEEWRENMLGTQSGHVNMGFWGDGSITDDGNPGAIRVLVCGNTGVGKSTLINKTFGVEVTPSSNRVRGIHDVTQEITFDGRPDLIVHDSGGFEAGTDTEFLAIEKFLKAKSSAEEIQDRLHVIWFCVELNSARTLQTATEKLFQAVGQYAHEVPVVVVATKKDDFLDIEYMAKKKELKRSGLPFDEELCEAYAEEKLHDRLDEVRREMESVPGGRLDAIVAVSQGDEESIAFLSKTTSHTFDLDKVRLLYIRAQVTRIDLKVDLALHEVMRRYRSLVRAATGVAFTPIAASAHRKTAAAKACTAILNCFGLPSVSAETAIANMKQNVWDHLGFDFFMAIAEGLNLLGVAGMGVGGGMPAIFVTGIVSIPLVVPSTCRLFLTMSVDLILVLILSFKQVALQNRQPLEKDLQHASREYRLKGYSDYAHEDIKALVPRRNMAASFRYDKIRNGLEKTVENYKSMAMQDAKVSSESKLRRNLSVTEEDEDDARLIRQANQRLVELEGSSLPIELPAGREAITTELPAIEAPVELSGDAPPRRAVELPGHFEFDMPGGGKTMVDTAT